MNDNKATPAPAQQDSLAEDLNALKLMIDNARGQLAQGEMVDLAPLGEQISGLCEAALALNDAEGGSPQDPLINELIQLRDELEKLERDLVHRQSAEGLS